MVMFRRTLWIGLALSLVGFVSVAAGQGTYDKTTLVTFSQPVEIAGRVLPAGTYTFMLADASSDQTLVEIFNADGTQLITTVRAIPNYRLQPTGRSVIKLGEAPSGSPEVITAWFYPGENFGREFVSPKRGALDLIKAATAPLPPTAAEVPTPAEATTPPVAAAPPETKEVPVAPVIEPTPPEATPPELPARQEMPKTASNVPLIALLGLGSIGVALGLIVVARRAGKSTV
jgi:hypothetical protein